MNLENSIMDLSEYISLTHLFQGTSELSLFRGQTIRGNLLPSIARKNPEYDSTKLEKTILNQFKLLGSSMLNGIENNSLELMVVAQHYGLKTRLLDWTRNPLAALYFACADKNGGDAYVYCLSADDLMSPDPFGKDPFLASKTSVFQPPYNNPRITAQQGWFTLHMFSDSSKKFVALEKNSGAKQYLTEIRIEAEYRTSMLKSLANIGVGHHTMFPDLSGLSLHLNAIHEV